MKRGLLRAAVLASGVASIPMFAGARPVAAFGQVYAKLAVTEALRAKVSLARSSSELPIEWRFAPDGRFTEGVAAYAEQRLPMDFEIDAADGANPDDLLVAGYRDGHVRIVRLRLCAPEVRELPTGGYGLEPRPPASTRVVYDAPYGSRGRVVTMVANRGRAGRSFVRFERDDDLFELDWSVEEPLDPKVVLSAADEPRLRDRGLVRFSGSTHSRRGPVYKLLYAPDCIACGAALVLIDSNRDGSIDSHASPSTDELEAQGLLDPREYEEIENWPVE